jgi:hypothetical protein
VTPAAIPEITSDVTPEITTGTIDADTGQDAYRSEPAVAHEVTPEITTEMPARRRRVVPAKASDDELVVIILDATDDPATLTNYKVTKAIKAACGGKGVGEPRATRLVDLAQRRHRSRSVVAIGERR